MVGISFLTLAIVVSGALAKLGCNENVCTSPKCMVAAGDLVKSMNAKVDPCDDFYEYACGNWMDAKPYYYTDAIIFELDGKIYRELYLLVSSDIGSRDIESVKKVKQTFKACRNYDAIAASGVQPMKDLLREVGGWPVLENYFDERRFDVLETASKLAEYFVNPLFAMETETWAIKKDLKRSTFVIYEPDLNLRRSYFVDSRYSRQIEMYKDFAKKVAKKLGSTATDLDKQMNDMVDFEIALAKNKMSKSEEHSEETTFDNFKSRNTRIAFDTYINNKLSKLGVSKRVKYYTKMVNKGSEKYWKGLDQLIRDTNKKTIANYMAFCLVVDTIQLLDKSQFNGLIDNIARPLFGNRMNVVHCDTYITINNFLSVPMARMYIDQQFKRSDKVKVGEMVENIRTAFKTMLGKTTWMDSNARRAAIEKLEKTRTQIAYQDFLYDDAKVNAIVGQVVTASDTYYKNTLGFYKLWVDDNMKAFDVVIDGSEWYTNPYIVNAYNYQYFNKITIPAGFIQEPAYNSDYPEYLNYGGIGTIMGHELTHSFDNYGHLFDKEGNNHTIWSSSVESQYARHAQCFVDQYNKFYVPPIGKYIDGALTLQENQADNGGILESFLAYRTHMESLNKEDKLLPGIDLTPNQLFFLNAAQTFCGKRMDWDWYSALKEVHAPLQFRIKGMMINSPDFHKAYKCAKGTKMNPRKQCNMW